MRPNCRLLVVKVTSRCNLNCSYCYMFNGGDVSYLRRPALMSADTVNALLSKVHSHCVRHKIEDFSIVFHGGEPLLAPQSFFRDFVGSAHRISMGNISWHFSLQTNGVRVNSEWCALFSDLNISVGFSLDGPEAVNDRHRKDHMGRGSFERVIKGWNTAVAHGIDPGLLCVIDVHSDPLEVYALLHQLRPREMDFLLPDATRDKPPPGYVLDSKSTPYADWLLQIFRAWTTEDDPTIRIRIFRHIMESMVGRANGLDFLGTGDTEVLVVETDGEIQSSDVLRICKPEMTLTNFNVATHELDDALNDDLIKLYVAAHRQLCASCESCDIKAICGGGFLPHRFSSSREFDNPSIYCRDLSKLITEIGAWFVPQVPRDRLIISPSPPG
jgi:uncharacterized protein